MTTRMNEDDVSGGPVALNTRKDGEGAESERESGSETTSGTFEPVDALHGANSGKSEQSRTPTVEDLRNHVAFLKAQGPRETVTIEERQALAVSIMVRGYEPRRAWGMMFDPAHPEYVEDNDGALQMLARHRAKWEVPLNALRAGPQFFAVAGMVETDLKERYESLRVAMDEMTLNRDNLREYLAERTEQRDAAQVAFDGANASADRARRILRAVVAEATRAPADIGEAVSIPPGKRQAQQAAGVALWQQSCTANVIRFVAELATMTEIECEFLDGHELRGIAQLLQVPDDEGNRAPTVPRLYAVEDRERAAEKLRATWPGMTTAHNWGDLVDGIAEALGMRRAGA